MNLFILSGFFWISVKKLGRASFLSFFLPYYVIQLIVSIVCNQFFSMSLIISLSHYNGGEVN